MKLIQNKLVFENLQKMLVNRKYKLDDDVDLKINTDDKIFYLDEKGDRIVLINDILTDLKIDTLYNILPFNSPKPVVHYILIWDNLEINSDKLIKKQNFIKRRFLLKKEEIEIFTTSYFHYNLIDHKYVSHHVKLKDYEIYNLVNKSNIDENDYKFFYLIT